MSDGEFPISGDPLRRWLRTDFAATLSSGKSGKAILEELRGQGVRIRTSEFYAIRRQVLAERNLEQIFREHIREYDPNGLIPAAWHSTEHGLNLRSQYLYRVRVTGYDNVTNEWVERISSISSNEQMSVSQIKDEMTSHLTLGIDSDPISIESMDMHSALARPGTWG